MNRPRTSWQRWLGLILLAYSGAGWLGASVGIRWGGSVPSDLIGEGWDPRPTAPVISGTVAVRVGDTLILETTAPEGVALQWHQDGAALPGATGTRYERVAITAAAAGEYWVVAANVAGSASSRPVRVVVAPAAGPAANWRALERTGGQACFLFDESRRVERYNLAARAWLPPVVLGEKPVAFAPGVDGFYYATAAATRQRTVTAPDGTSSVVAVDVPSELHWVTWAGADTRVRDLTETPQRLSWWDEFLVTVGRSGPGGTLPTVVRSFRRATGELVDTFSDAIAAGLEFHGLAAGTGRLYGLQDGRVIALTLAADGALGDTLLSFPATANSGSTLHLAQDEAVIVNAAGAVLDVARDDLLTHIGAVEDLAVAGDGATVILQRGRLAWLDDHWVETQAHVPSGPAPAALALHGTVVALFTPNATGGNGGAGDLVDVAWVERAALTAPLPAPVFDPGDRPVVIEDILLDRDGAVLILSRTTRNVLRWSPATKAFLPSFALRGAPVSIAYASELHRLYVLYAGGTITRVDAGTGAEEAFARAAPGDLLGGMAAAGRYLVVAAGAPWSVHMMVYDETGATRHFPSVAARITLGPARLVWDSVGSRFFGLSTRGDFVGFQRLNADGSLGLGYSRQVATSGAAAPGPFFALTPGGATLLLGDGSFREATSLALANPKLNFRVEAAAWLGDQLFTAHTEEGDAAITGWNATTHSKSLEPVLVRGGVCALLTLDVQRLLAVTNRGNTLCFTELDASLDVLSTSSSAAPSRLINLSARAQVGTGHAQLIPGFVTAGGLAKPFLLRVAGPALAPAGVPGHLTDPRLTLFRGAEAIAANDDWSTLGDRADFLQTGASVGATPFPTDSRDAGLLATLTPGAYSAHIAGADGAHGVAVVEVFDAAPRDARARLVNLSARAQVGSGEEVLIVGFVIEGVASLRVLIHGLGLQLDSPGPAALADPRLDLHAGEALLASNNDWQESAALWGAWEQLSGIRSLDRDSQDAALLVDLPPGLYSVILRGSGTETGIGMIELYEVPDF